MKKKFILVPLVATVTLVALVAVSLTVFALVVDPAAAQSDKTVTLETAPIHVEPVVSESQVRYEGFSDGGCSHSAKMQLTYKSNQETIETPNDQLLTQVQP